jgi:hypothetical protein
MAAMFTFISEANRELDAAPGRDAAALERARAAFRLMDGVLDLVPEQEADAELGGVGGGGGSPRGARRASGAISPRPTRSEPS